MEQKKVFSNENWQEALPLEGEVVFFSNNGKGFNKAGRLKISNEKEKRFISPSGEKFAYIRTRPDQGGFMKTYDIWIEGYAATGQSASATYLGESAGIDFRDACKRFFHQKKDGHLYDKASNSYWCCSLFTNHADAAKSFG